MTGLLTCHLLILSGIHKRDAGQVALHVWRHDEWRMPPIMAGVVTLVESEALGGALLSG